MELTAVLLGFDAVLVAAAAGSGMDRPASPKR